MRRLRAAPRPAALLLLLGATALAAGPARGQGSGGEERPIALFPVPQQVHTAGEPIPFGSLGSIEIVASTGTPIRFQRKLWDRLESLDLRPVVEEGGTRIRLLNLRHGEDMAELAALGLNRAPHPPFGQGYLLDLATKPDTFVVAGDDERGLWYGLLTLLQVLEHGREHGRIPRLVIQDHPDIEHRGVHVQGYDKGYGAGNRWTAGDLVHGVPDLIDAAAEARLTYVRLHFEAGWINEADRVLGVDLDEIISGLIAYGRERSVGVMVEVEYSGWPDREDALQAIRRLRGLEAGMTSRDAIELVEEWRAPLCAIEDRGYYLRAIRRVLSWQPWAIDVSFNDHARGDCPASRRVYGTGDIVFHGEALAHLANEVEALRQAVSPGTRFYFLPRFYSDAQWPRHPDALPTFLAGVPRSLIMITTAEPSHGQLKEMRERHDARFAFWKNTTSNHMKDMKVWFPLAEFQSGDLGSEAGQDYGGRGFELQWLEGEPGSEIIFNLGAPERPSMLSAMMSGAWVWNHERYESATMLERAAERLYGPEVAPLIREYGELVTWPVVRESLGRDIVTRLEASSGLSTHMRVWREYRDRASAAAEIARRLAAAAPPRSGDLAEAMRLSAERIVLDYDVALALAAVVSQEQPSSGDWQALEQSLDELKRFLQTDYYGIPFDVKNAEVRARGFRLLQQFTADLRRSR